MTKIPGISALSLFVLPTVYAEQPNVVLIVCDYIPGIPGQTGLKDL